MKFLPFIGAPAPSPLPRANETASSVHSGGGSDSAMEEASGPRHNGVDGERQRDPEAREPEVVDSPSAAAEINIHRRGSVDKYKFSSYGYQVRGGGGRGGGLVVFSVEEGRGVAVMILSPPEEDQGESRERLFHAEQGIFCRRQTQGRPQAGPVQSGGV